MMGILDKIFGISKIAESISNPIDSIGKLYTTDKERLEAESKLAEVEQRPLLQQLQSQDFFEAAWPALAGWTAGACLALYYVPQLIVTDWIWMRNCFEMNTVLRFPMDSTDIIHLVYLMFGYGTYSFLKNKK